MRTLLTLALLLIPTTLLRADQPIQAQAPDGKTIARARDQVIIVSDTATQKDLLSIRAHTDTITALKYAPDGKRLVSGDKGGAVLVFDIATGRLLWKHRLGAAVASLGFSADGKELKATDTANRSTTLDPATGKALQ
jgi:WD40 repeat protein